MKIPILNFILNSKVDYKNKDKNKRLHMKQYTGFNFLEIKHDIFQFINF